VTGDGVRAAIRNSQFAIHENKASLWQHVAALNIASDGHLMQRHHDAP
jgi:hypothetical protein